MADDDSEQIPPPVVEVLPAVSEHSREQRPIPPGLIPFRKGQSGNPGGRPKGSRAFAAKIREMTRNGEEVIEVALEIMRRGAEDKDRIAAAKFLAERMFGRAPLTITGQVAHAHLHGSVGAAEPFDLSRLTYEEAAQLRALTAKALPGAEKQEEMSGEEPREE